MASVIDLNRRYTTKQNSEYWAKRKGWKEYQETWNHPHRNFLVHILGQMRWTSLIEVGCGSGPNLLNILKNLTGRQIGGIDINPEAIAVASEAFQFGHFKVGSAEDIMMSDNSTDVVLTDAFLIYIGPFKIRKYLKELLRIARTYVVLVEYHEKSWWRRQMLRILSGRHSYDYKKLLKDMGCYDVMSVKIPAFEEDNEQRFRHVIIARVPR